MHIFSFYTLFQIHLLLPSQVLSIPFFNYSWRHQNIHLPRFLLGKTYISLYHSFVLPETESHVSIPDKFIVRRHFPPCPFFQNKFFILRRSNNFNISNTHLCLTFFRLSLFLSLSLSGFLYVSALKNNRISFSNYKPRALKGPWLLSLARSRKIILRACPHIRHSIS